MSFLPVALPIIGTLFSGISAFGQANYQAQVAKNNAKIAERNANLASQAAQEKALRSDREYAAMRGTVLAQQGASGLGVLGQSQLATRQLVERGRQESALDIRNQGGLESESFNNQAAAFKGQANSAKAAGISSLIGSVIDAAGQGYSAFGGKKPTSKKYPWSN